MIGITPTTAMAILIELEGICAAAVPVFTLIDARLRILSMMLFSSSCSEYSFWSVM